MPTDGADGVDGAEGVGSASYYGEDIFDDLIAKVTSTPAAASDAPPDGTSDRNARRKNDRSKSKQGSPTRRSRKRSDDSKEGGSDDDDDDDDVASLDSDEISGGSDVSDVESRAMKDGAPTFVPAPLVNDDESTIDMRPPAPQSQTVSSYVDQLNRAERSKGRLIKAGACFLFLAIVVGIIVAAVMLTGGKGGGGDAVAQAAAPRGAPAIPNPAPTLGEAATAAPSLRPVVLTPVETVHPIQLTLQNLPDGYRLPENHRTSIVGYVGELLEGRLDDEFELMEVAYAYDRVGTPARRLAESLTLPLRVVVRGPPNFSEEFVRSYLVDELGGRANNVRAYLNALDYDAFQSVRVAAGTYDPWDLTMPTASPSLRPQTAAPTARPSPSPETDEPTGRPTPSPAKSIVVDKDTVTKPLFTRAPSDKPTNDPTREPTREPTDPPTLSATPRPTDRPTLRPTPRPTPRPTFRPTRRPTPRPTLRPQPRPTPRPTRRPTGGGLFDDLINNPTSGQQKEYFCAEKSYTENWNIVLDFGTCDEPCPSASPTDCPGGSLCSQTDQCNFRR